jgi:hypothetical protein
MLEGFLPVCKPWLVTVPESLRSYQAEIPLRELRKAFLYAAEVKVEDIACLVGSALYEVPAGIDARQEIRRRAMRFREFDELGLLQRPAHASESFLQNGIDLVSREEPEQVGKMPFPRRFEPCVSLQLVEERARLAQFRVAELARRKQATLPVHEPDVQALRIAGQGIEVVEEANVRLEQYVGVMIAYEAEQFEKVLVVIEGR